MGKRLVGVGFELGLMIFAFLNVLVALIVLVWALCCHAETADIYDGSGNFAGQIIESDDGGTVNIYDGDGNFAGQIVDQDEGDDD